MPRRHERWMYISVPGSKQIRTRHSRNTQLNWNFPAFRRMSDINSSSVCTTHRQPWHLGQGENVQLSLFRDSNTHFLSDPATIIVYPCHSLTNWLTQSCLVDLTWLAHRYAIFSVLWMLPPIFQCPIVFGVSGKFIDQPELELELEAVNFDQSFNIVIFSHFLCTRLDCVPSKNVPLAGLPVHPEHLVGGSPQLRVCVSVEPVGKKR